MGFISWLFALEAVVIVAVNVVTIVVFTTTPRLRTRQNALIVSVAVADLLVGLVSVPMHITFEETYAITLWQPKWSVFMLVYFMQDMFFGSASLFGLAALSVERAHATYFPFQHNTLSKVPFVVGMAVVWVLALVACLASYIVCTNVRIYLNLKTTIVTISLIIIFTGYLLILVKVRCHATQHHQSINHGNRKLTVTLAIVTAISLITWVPYQCLVLYSAISRNLRFPTTYWIVRSVTKVLHFGNPLSNFFVYAFRMREFKTVLIRRFTCRGNQVSPRDDVELANSFRRSATSKDQHASVIHD